MEKWVYLFKEGSADMRNLLGGKGANLAEMTNIGLPVPQGFTITTEACTQYYEDGREINGEIRAQIDEYIGKMEEITGKKFGDKKNPLLVSVRSGARASMPGMMDTILNLGLNEEVVNAIAEMSGNPRWAWDCYRRFIQMYSDVVMEVGKKYFEELIDEMKEKRGVKQDVELTTEDLKELAAQFKAEYKEKIGQDFPDDPKEQLMGAIKAVFRSWDNPRANVYRRDNDIPYSWGTAVNVQSMAFGNMGDDCGTGVAFTRDPATGEKGLFGEFLTNAQGEDVVAGVRTPMKIAEMEQKFPEAFKQFTEVCQTLEKHYRDMQDMEFTVEHGKLYMLQTRNGKRTAQAALKIACDLVDEGMRTEEEAVAMIDPRNLDTLLHPQFDAAALKAATPVGKGLGASPGAACGKIVFSAEDAENWASLILHWHNTDFFSGHNEEHRISQCLMHVPVGFLLFVLQPVTIFNVTVFTIIINVCVPAACQFFRITIKNELFLFLCLNFKRIAIRIRKHFYLTGGHIPFPIFRYGFILHYNRADSQSYLLLISKNINSVCNRFPHFQQFRFLVCVHKIQHFKYILGHFIRENVCIIFFHIFPVYHLVHLGLPVRFPGFPLEGKQYRTSNGQQ